jgi:hypothetical protein
LARETTYGKAPVISFLFYDMMMKTSISRFDGVLVKSSHDWCDLGIGGQDKIVSVDEIVRVLSIW